MYHSGFLLLTAPLKQAAEAIGNHLLVASKHIRSKLYVKLEPTSSLWPTPKTDTTYLKTISPFLPKFYDNVSRTCGDVDVRLVVRPRSDPLTSARAQPFSKIDVIFTDSSDDELNIRKYMREHFNEDCLKVVRLSGAYASEWDAEELDDGLIVYDTVILGGTFDRLHNGHKVLLTSAVLRTSRRLVVGVTDGSMLKRKFLWELIEPVQKRMNDVLEFLMEIAPSIEYSIVPIYDAFGPSIEDPDMDCIVVSNETKRGGDLVNAERAKRNMKPLDLVIVDLVPDPCPNVGDEAKASSSNLRRSLLGKYIKPPPVISVDVGPMRIALIGGSHEDCFISTKLKELGACIVDCETLLYEMIKPGSEIHDNIIQQMEESVPLFSNSNGKSILCGALLRNKVKLKVLKSCVQQKLQSRVETEINSFVNQGVIVIKVPLFLGVDWLDKVHQIWGIITPEAQQVQQMLQSCSISEQEALKLVGQDMFNSEIIKMSHLIFSLQGDSEFITYQVHKAWKLLHLK